MKRRSYIVHKPTIDDVKPKTEVRIFTCRFCRGFDLRTQKPKWRFGRTFTFVTIDSEGRHRCPNCNAEVVAPHVHAVGAQESAA